MKIQKINFTSQEPQQQRESGLYSKKGYMTLLNSARFTEGLLGGFAALEIIDKFQLIKNPKNIPVKELKSKAWKHTKWNILGGVAAGIISVLVGKVMDKKLIPWNEKLWDWSEKQQAIAKKQKELNEQAKEIVEKEITQKAEEKDTTKPQKIINIEEEKTKKEPSEENKKSE